MKAWFTMDILEEYKSYKNALRLKPRYLDIFEYRHGLANGEKHSLDECGSQFHISGTLVRQIVARVEYEIGNIVNGRVG